MKSLFLQFFKFSILFVLLSCASHVVISPVGCESRAKWGVNQDRGSVETDQKYVLERFDFKKTVMVSRGRFGKNKILIKDLLRQNGITCSSLRNLEITLSSTWVDVLRGFLPVVGSKTVRLTGSYILEYVADDDDIAMD